MPGPLSSSTFSGVSEAAAELQQAVQELHTAAQVLQPAPLDSHEWYELLRQKLLPQLGQDAWLVAAVVGGTNTGKSVIFNHLAGCRASSTSPLASGTKHPVCLVPEGFTDRHDLPRLFPDFELHEWTNADRALQETSGNELFWKTASELPPTLLVLDTPDIDSDARVNWIRADAIRRSADVLIAVLTQQKYNDAAVKDFFRKAAAEDRTVIVVFNQCELPEDESYWPIWIDTFCSETGTNPEHVYLAPNDRSAAEELRLPFYERPWPPAPGEHRSCDSPPRSLKDDLSRLKFRDIRLRSLRGSLRELLRPDHGIPGWMQDLSRRGADLNTAARLLSSDIDFRVRDWPGPPTAAFVAEIRAWWRSRQSGWAHRINSVYDTVSRGLLWPLRKARQAIQGEPPELLTQYQEREWTAILTTIEELFSRLQLLADSGNDLIRPRVETILQGASRSELMAALKRQHQMVDFEAELSAVVAEQMEHFRTDDPKRYELYRQLHHVSAAIRPVTSVVLFSLGFGPAGEAVAPLVADAAAGTVIHVATDFAGGAAATVVGDTALGTAAGQTAGRLQAWFRGLHERFILRRIGWLTTQIRRNILGTLPEDLQRAAAIARTPEWNRVHEAVTRIERLLQEIDA